jgi:hypothetical protein
MGLIRRKEGIEHIDTNIVIRMIVGDSPKDYKRAEKLLSKKNKIFVFESRSWSAQILRKEIPAFVGARLFSFGLEELLLWISKDVIQVSRFSVTVLGLVIGGLMIAKLLISVLVVILNYVFSKLFIFKQKKD